MGRHSTSVAPSPEQTRWADVPEAVRLSTRPTPLAAQADAREVDELPVSPYRPVPVRGTLAAERASLELPGLRATSLDTGPVRTVSVSLLPARREPARASTLVRTARVAGLVAALATITVVTAQLTAPHSLADQLTGSTSETTGTASPTGAPASSDSASSTVPPSTMGTPSHSPVPMRTAGNSPTVGTSAAATPQASDGTSAPATERAPSRSASVTPSDTSPSPSSDPPTADPPAADPAPAGTSLRTLVRAAGGSDVALGSGVFSFSDFGGDLLGIGMTGALQGQGSSDTVLQMTPGSSTKRSSVPTKDWTTNQLSLLKVSHASTLSGFTLRGTDQGHLYNGLRISQSSNARVSDVRVTAVPGSDDIPPGETFGINDYRTDGTRYSDVEVDGSGVSGSAFGTNNSSDVTIADSSFHDAGHANGVTFWQTRDVTVRNTASTGNKDAAFNFERVSGTVLLDHVTMRNNRLSDLRINSDQGSAVYRIVDPVFSGSKIDIVMTPRYMGSPNLQRKSDVHVIVGGVDRTADLVHWVDHF